MNIKHAIIAASVAAFASSLSHAATLFTLADTDDVALSHSSADTDAAPPTAGGVDLGNGTFTWGDLLTDSGGNTAEFSAGVFTSADWGGLGTFESDAIDVSAVATVDIAGTFSGFFNTGAEFSNFFFSTDGGVNFTDFGAGVEDATATNQAVSVNGLDVSTASTLIVGFTFSHNGGSDSFDVGSLTVEGTPIPEPMTVAAGLLGIGGIMLRRRSAV
ncbi:MAG: PEP-CTERM sorting domain-containing protein [Planctomycetota bacterium]